MEVQLSFYYARYGQAVSYCRQSLQFWHPIAQTLANVPEGNDLVAEDVCNRPNYRKSLYGQTTIVHAVDQQDDALVCGRFSSYVNIGSWFV